MFSDLQDIQWDTGSYDNCRGGLFFKRVPVKTSLTTTGKSGDHFEEEIKGHGSGLRAPETTTTAGQTPQ